MFGFRASSEVADYQFALEAFMRMVAGAYTIGGARNIERTLRKDSNISTVDWFESPRGPEIYFTFLEPFAAFSGFAEIPEKVEFMEFGVNLQGHEQYDGFGASLYDPDGQVVVSVSRLMGRPTRKARQLKKIFVSQGASDVDI